ncbi:hypothetical protein IFM89_005046 [Coptis chinensis]|uniref:SAC domain-containing protein n=1 Tax=Coptis chinensis TaxID=261450 RepID=A0A835HL02_9MAGN|nr:hypothetical protein IFM89_005046 [Coptis chinensis]
MHITQEKKHQESILHAEFANAIKFINNDLPEASRIKFLHWDIHKHCRSRNGGRQSSAHIYFDGKIENIDNLESQPGPHNEDINENQSLKPLKFQKGVLRTNCIDCLDRTNVAQYSYGLAALGHQLRALGFIDEPRVDLSSPLADDLMQLYEAMGDTLALQYGGSPTHNKIYVHVMQHYRQELIQDLDSLVEDPHKGTSHAAMIRC